MFAIRYAALLALVVWLGGMIMLVAGSLVGPIQAHFHLVEYACGFVVLVCLFALKFIGPPPHAFIPRVTIVVLMLIVAVASGFSFERSPQVSAGLLAVNAVLGLVLLYWYVKE
jgi:hypothetical protein